MRDFNILPKNLVLLLAPVSFFLLASCGSYQYSGYEDGIYGEANRNTNERQNQNANQEEDNSSYYQNLFAEEAALYGEILSDNAIFTDVESYSSAGGEYQPGELYNYQGGHAPWGHDPDTYSVNIYNNGFHGGFFNPFWGGGLAFDPFFGPGYWGPGFWGPGHWGPGYWGPGMWGNNWRIGFGGFGPYGFNYGFGGFGGFGPGYWGGGFYSPYNNFGYNYGYANNYRQNEAYNTGRRNTTSSYGNRSNTSANRSAAIQDSRGRTSSYSRSIRNLRGSNDNYRVTRRTVGREYSNRSNTEYNTNRRSSSRIINSRSSNNTYSRSQVPATRNSSTIRRNNTSRSSGVIRSSGSTRSSGAIRSSSGGVRSSGGTSSRGRGN